MRMSFSDLPDLCEYHLALVVCGYESRSRYMAEVRNISSCRKVALGYGHGEELAFESNRTFLLGSGFDFNSIRDEEFEGYIEDLIRSSRKEEGHFRVLLDISCLTRLRLAQIIEALVEAGSFELDVFYSLAEFSPPAEVQPKNEFLCPVTDYLSGWTGDASKPVVVISGLGYEQMMALGIIEHIDPADAWLFFPESPDERYDEAVRRSNNILLAEAAPSNVISYPVMSGDVLSAKLFSLVDSLRRDYRCILMPLGPKIFALASIVAGCYYRDVSVWRASAGKHYFPVDRKSSGDFAQFRISYQPGFCD